MSDSVDRFGRTYCGECAGVKRISIGDNITSCTCGAASAGTPPASDAAIVVAWLDTVLLPFEPHHIPEDADATLTVRVGNLFAIRELLAEQAKRSDATRPETSALASPLSREELDAIGRQVEKIVVAMAGQWHVGHRLVVADILRLVATAQAGLDALAERQRLLAIIEDYIRVGSVDEVRANRHCMESLEGVTAIYWPDRGGSIPAGMTARGFLETVRTRSGRVARVEGQP